MISSKPVKEMALTPGGVPATIDPTESTWSRQCPCMLEGLDAEKSPDPDALAAFIRETSRAMGASSVPMKLTKASRSAPRHLVNPNAVHIPSISPTLLKESSAMKHTLFIAVVAATALQATFASAQEAPTRWAPIEQSMTALLNEG